MTGAPIGLLPRRWCKGLDQTGAMVPRLAGRGDPLGPGHSMGRQAGAQAGVATYKMSALRRSDWPVPDPGSYGSGDLMILLLPSLSWS